MKTIKTLVKLKSSSREIHPVCSDVVGYQQFAHSRKRFVKLLQFFILIGRDGRQLSYINLKQSLTMFCLHCVPERAL